MLQAQSGPGSDPFAAELRRPLPRGVPRTGEVKAQSQQYYNPPSYVSPPPPPPPYVRGGGEDDDDAMSVYSQQTQQQQRLYDSRSLAPSVAYLPHDQLYPPLDDKTRAERLQYYHDIRYPGKSPEEVEMEAEGRIAANNLALETQVQMMEFSKSFMDVKRCATIPQYCRNLHYNNLSAQVTFSSKGETKETDWFPKDPQIAFGSIFDWGQGGINVKAQEEPSGDLANVYLLRFYFTHFRNTSPVQVGVVLGEKRGNDFKPLGRRSFYCDSGYSGSKGAINTFHFIIPPFGESFTEADLYISTSHVNNAYGKDFPFMTSSRESILDKCVPIGEGGAMGHYVPLRHPIARWCFEESNLPETEMPVLSKDHGDQDKVHFRVPKKTIEMAIQELRRKAALFIPVTDMRTLTMRFYPLVNGPLSADLLMRDELERDYDLQNKWVGYSAEGATKADAKRESNKAQLKHRYGISFSVGFFLMFRRWAKDAVNPDDPNDEFAPREDDEI